MFGFTAALEPQQPVTQSEAIQQTLDCRVMLVGMQGPNGPATMEFLIDSLREAAACNAELLIFRMDTPGGLVHPRAVLSRQDLIHRRRCVRMGA
jgi:membrane-bound ClpP family serine protease